MRNDNNDFPVVAQFIDAYYPTVDGVVRTVHSYSENINKSSYCCVVAPCQCKNHGDDSLPYDVFRIKSIKLPIAEYRLPLLGFNRDVNSMLKTKDFKIFHAHTPFLLGHYALRKGRKYGVKVIATFHSKYYDDVLHITHSKILAKIVMRYIVRFYNKVDSVWTVSNGTAETLRSYGYKGDIFVLDNGTDYIYPENADELRNAACEKYNLSKDTPTLVFVGHQIWQKNLKLVLETSKELKARGFSHRLLVVGTGYDEKSIKQYAAKLGLDSTTVSFLGQITEKGMLQGIELASNVMFFPSIYDNAPLVIREAAAMGLPSILMKNSNAAEPTKDGYDAFHCENDAVLCADLIERIFADRENLIAVGENAKKTIGRNWKDILPKVKEKYQNIQES